MTMKIAIDIEEGRNGIDQLVVSLLENDEIISESSIPVKELIYVSGLMPRSSIPVKEFIHAASALDRLDRS